MSSEVIARPAIVRPRILLVDDHEDTRRLLLLALEFEGYDVVSASTAEEGLRLLEADRFDALLSDYCLPGQSGGWLLNQATKKRLIPVERAVVLTAHPQPDGVEPYRIVRKPFELDQLFETVAMLLDSRIPESCTPGAPAIELVLYISSHSWQSTKALRNLEAALGELQRSDLELTIKDLSADPSAGDEDHITFTPTLVKRRPAPRAWILGDLSSPEMLQEFLQGCSAPPVVGT